MKYQNLNTLPLKVYQKIKDNIPENIHLLSTDDSEKLPDLINHWNNMDRNFKEIDKITKSNGFSIVKVIIELAYLKKKHHVIYLSLKALEFAYNQDLIDLIRSHGYQISRRTLKADIKKLHKIIEAQTECIEFLPDDINQFDLMDYYVCWTIILDKYLDIISYGELTVGTYFEIQKEAINFLNEIRKS